MELDELADGSLYVDTNVLYMYLRADPVHLPTLTTFFGRVVRGAIEAFIPQTHRLLPRRVVEWPRKAQILYVKSGDSDAGAGDRYG